MKILFANEKLGWFGGVEQNIVDTAAGLRERGHECFLAWRERTERDPDGYASNFARTSPCRDLGATEGEGLLHLSNKFGADCLYLHKIPRLPSSPVGAHPPPMVRMVHDHDLCCPRRHKYFFHNARVCTKPSGWRCWLDLAWLESAPGSRLGIRLRGLKGHFREMRRNHDLDLLLAGSRFMREELEMNGFPSERIRVLPPVVRRERQNPTPTATHPHILYVGQLIRGKGVDQLLDALTMLNCQFKASIVGDGNARPALEEQCRRLRLTERVQFTGWVPNSELSVHYASARVLAVPVRWPEPFGMIGLEAMHQARPIVAFATGGIPDWLADGDNGYLIREGDIPGFARALEKLLMDRDLATHLGFAGWERVRREFSFEGYLDQLTACLQEASS